MQAEALKELVVAALEDIKAVRPVRTGFAQPDGCAIKYPETLEG
jgi:hypothetical protein